LADRVTTMAAEDVEFMVSSDRDAVTDFAPVIEDMGLENFISSAIGLEVTTIEIGHFLGFPLLHNYLADNGGALDWTGLEPQEILDGIRQLGDPNAAEQPVVFVGHPRDGILGYFDQYGLDAYASDGNLPLVAPSLAVALTSPIIASDTWTDDFDGIELLNSKRLEFIRTPLSSELQDYGKDNSSVSIYDMIERTMDEQQGLIDGTYTLGGGGHEGTIDDWFNLLNLGYHYTALGNSDTHDKTHVEAGCPRNFVASETDDPALLRPEDIAKAVREGRVVASYGPFIRFYVDDPDTGPGSTVVKTGEVTLSFDVQSPSWFDVERVEVYENGTLIAEYAIPSPNSDVINLSEQLTVNPDGDAWYVVIAMGSGDLSPVFTPVEIPPVQLQDVVVTALDGVPGVSTLLDVTWPIPRAFPIHPYALTNPIWIDRDGDGFDPPGLATWLVDPGL
ncbi:MAG: CehA/McbA family metallohydrolase, partial [Oligoflexia bacterium]|nr:CehA/McbA family metallohydrolase [Oligoflexia bacterium]